MESPEDLGELHVEYLYHSSPRHQKCPSVVLQAVLDSEAYWQVQNPMHALNNHVTEH